MLILTAALLIGVIAGLRAMTAPAGVSWAAYLGWVPLGGTALAFLGSIYTVGILTLLALVELVTDQLPQTPSRTVPMQFSVRIVMGGFCGAAVGLPADSWILGAIAGIVGAVIGTLGGAATRQFLAARFGSDRPAALLEDLVAIVGAGLVLATA